MEILKEDVSIKRDGNKIIQTLYVKQELTFKEAYDEHQKLIKRQGEIDKEREKIKKLKENYKANLEVFPINLKLMAKAEEGLKKGKKKWEKHAKMGEIIYKNECKEVIKKLLKDPQPKGQKPHELDIKIHTHELVGKVFPDPIIRETMKELGLYKEPKQLNSRV